MDFMLRDKVVLMTGGAEGIGAAIIVACSEEGAIPVIVDRDQTAGGELKAKPAARASETCCTATTWHTTLSPT